MLWIVCPCYRDAPSVERLHAETRRIHGDVPFRFVVIDDTAGRDSELSRVAALRDVEIVTPPYNLGHQRAFVYALRMLRARVAADDVVVTMDGDGEDRPEDVPRLLATLAEAGDPHRVVLARRAKRSERWMFRAGYRCFQLLFRIATGIPIASGNFAAFHGVVVCGALPYSVHHPHFDRCFSTAWLGAGFPCTFVPLPRGRRYAGESRMSWLRLVAHGFRMMSPFRERIVRRALVAGLVALVIVLVAGADDA